MCMGRKSVSIPETPKAEPTPTAVQPVDVQEETSGSAERKARRRATGRRTAFSADRDTILGSLSGGRDTMG